MNSLGIENTRRRLPELVSAARRGQTTVITKHGRPYAALVPVTQAQKQRKPPRSILALKGVGAGLWGSKPERTIAKLRAEWK